MDGNKTRRELLKLTGAVSGSSVLITQTGNVSASNTVSANIEDKKSVNGYEKRSTGPNAQEDWTKAGFGQGLTLLKEMTNSNGDNLYEVALSMYGAKQQYGDGSGGPWSTFQTEAQGSRIRVENGSLWEPDHESEVGAFAKNGDSECDPTTSFDISFSKLTKVMKTAIYDVWGIPSTPEAVAAALGSPNKQTTADLNNEFQIIFNHECTNTRLDQFGHFVKFYVEERKGANGGGIPLVDITSTASQRVLGEGSTDVDTKLNRPSEPGDKTWSLIRESYNLYDGYNGPSILSESTEKKATIDYEDIQDPRLKEFADGDELKVYSGSIETKSS